MKNNSGKIDLFKLTWVRKKERKETSTPVANPSHLFVGLLLLLIVTGIYFYLFFGISREPGEVSSYLVFQTPSPSPTASPSPSPSPSPKRMGMMPPPPPMGPGPNPPGFPPPPFNPGQPPPPPGQMPQGMPPQGMPPAGQPGSPAAPGVITETPQDPQELPENPCQKVDLYIYSNIPANVFIDDSRGKRFYGKTLKSRKNTRLYSMKQELKWGTYTVELRRNGYKTIAKQAKYTKTLWEMKLFFNLEKSHKPDFSK